MALSFNGFGTTYYGYALQEPDGSYVVTEWIIVLFLPIIPLRSKRVWEIQKTKFPWWKFNTEDIGAGSKQSYKTTPVPLYIPHVIKGYAATIILLGLFSLIMLIIK